MSFSNSTPPRGFKAKFETFRQNIELTKKQREQIIAGQKHLRENLLQPLHFVDKTLLVGSYKKKTMIRPPSDVDVFVVVDEDEDNITPNAILNRLKKKLAIAYPNTRVRQDKPCIVLEFNLCKFELTPAIKGGWLRGGYYIPEQGGNTWQHVDDPKELEDDLATANRKYDGMLIQLIKMMKVCKRHNGFNNIRSFEMEQRAINDLWSSLDSYREGIQKLLKIYKWKVGDRAHWEIERMSDEAFLRFCRDELFGPDFPK